ncbi:MAG: manganese efflux pump MntP family protein [Eubacteriales bacterium]|nr:manganese efflux pump MntP family protein [Eubacteriales bacterium]
MGIAEIILVGLGLSMDAVAVAVSNSMVCSRQKARWLMPVFFGLFQGLMPLLGYCAGSLFANIISNYAGVVVCVILVFIGGKMLLEALLHKDDDKKAVVLTLKLILVQALATSIDAFAVGVGFSALGAGIVTAASIIALTTFACSLAAVLVGCKCGDLLGNKAEIFGGVILILIGIKALF